MARALARQGWEILARNWRRTGTELDVVARKGGTVVAVEVKARRRRGLSEELLSPRKRTALRRGIEAFAAEQRVTAETYRVDLAVVTPSGVEYVVDVL